MVNRQYYYVKPTPLVNKVADTYICGEGAEKEKNRAVSDSIIQKTNKWLISHPDPVIYSRDGLTEFNP